MRSVKKNPEIQNVFKDLAAAATCFQSVSHLLWALSGILHDLHILTGTKAIFKPAVTCVIVLVGIRTATETCRLVW